MSGATATVPPVAPPLQSPVHGAEPSAHEPWSAAAQALLVNTQAVRRYPGGAEACQLALLEQYKLYVDLTERLAHRRALANTFFLTLHSAVLTLVGVFWNRRPEGLPPQALLAPLGVALVLCVVWFVLIAYHRRLNRVKWAVVGAFEDLLPARPFVRTEWEGLMASRGGQATWSLTVLEQIVPVVYALAYVVSSVAAVRTA